MNKKQGQLLAANRDSSNLYKLTLTKTELVAIRVALQLDFETLTEFQNDESEWKLLLSVVGNTLAKVREMEKESE